MTNTTTTTASSIFEQAAILNNAGVVALCEQDEETAITVLTNSIRLMKRELSKPGVNLSSFQSTGVEELPTQMVELPNQACLQQQQDKQDHALLMLAQDDDDQALFNHAISIPLSSFCDTNQPTDLDIHIYSAAVVFNLALAHQQLASKHKYERRRQRRCSNDSGSTTSSSASSSQEVYTVNRGKAEKLYSVILKLLQDSVCSQVRTGVVVKLAAIHNLHWIQYQNRQEDDGIASSNSSGANNLQRTLSGFVQGIRQQDPHLARSFLEQDAQIQSLLMNVLWLKEQQDPPKVAPAA